jgi:hypothetical protein
LYCGAGLIQTIPSSGDSEVAIAASVRWLRAEKTLKISQSIEWAGHLTRGLKDVRVDQRGLQAVVTQ